MLNVKGMLKASSDKTSGFFTIEYEAEWDNNLPHIKESVEYFNQVAEEIL